MINNLFNASIDTIEIITENFKLICIAKANMVYLFLS